MKTFPIFAALIISIGCNVKKAIPGVHNGIYTIALNNTILEIDPQTGGRITSLKIEGKNFFTGKDVNEKYWGSTLWPSPQKEWGGKPPPELDHQPYTVHVEKNVIKMVSMKDLKFGYIFSKEIYADTKKNSFNIKYTITNKSDSLRKVSAWEVTRVHTNGVAFFPKGPGERWGNMATLAEDKDGITWFVYEEEKIPAKHQKFFADGSEGWIAQLNEDVLFIKKFSDISAEKAAPGEGEIEVYTNLEKSYVEIEQQGPYESLQPGESLVWEVKWFLRKVPAAINRQPGSKDLVAYVRTMVK
jgi:hypothetical protein